VKRKDLFALIAFTMPAMCARAHAFGERYDLPVPMSWVIASGCLVLVLTFLVTVFWPTPITRQSLSHSASKEKIPTNHPNPFQSHQQGVFGGLAIFFLLLCILCAKFGTQDPLMNFAPTFIWIIWWLGTSFGVVLFGNFWPLINPWHAIDTVIHSANVRPPLVYPMGLGQWPAVIALLCWCALEVVYPIASMPERLSWWIIAYTSYMLLGMSLFGQEVWSRCADGFSVYFELLSGPSKQKSIPSKTLELEPNPSVQWSQVSFVIAMFASVLFDGLHASQMWPLLEARVMRWGILSHDANGYQLGVLELICVWAFFVFAYSASCALACAWLKHKVKVLDLKISVNTAGLANHFSLSLIPIAVAYLLAHNFSTFFIQAQSIIALSSDPLGWQWNLFGMARFEVDVSVIDAKLTWYVATLSIVLGHMVSIVKSHRAAQLYLESLKFERNDSIENLNSQTFNVKAWKLNIPLTLLMMAFTALSLSIIAEPLANG